MTDNDAKEKAAEAAAQAEKDIAAEAEAEARSAGDDPTPWANGARADFDPAAAVLDIARLEEEKADLTDRLVRLAAEMDNLRKRTERETQDARKYALTKFAGDMLVVGDNLRRALEAVPAEKKETDEALKALVEGVEMTGREMDRLLEKHGITRIKAVGERFDPHLHQAMFEVPDPNVPAGTVAQVMQEGYQIGDRILRAALVGVAKGGPVPQASADKSAEAAATNDADAEKPKSEAEAD